MRIKINEIIVNIAHHVVVLRFIEKYMKYKRRLKENKRREYFIKVSMLEKDLRG